MKTIILIILSAATLTIQAQDYFYLYDSPTQKLDCPPSVQAVNLRDKNGDVQDYLKRGLGCLAVNTLVDSASGDTVPVSRSLSQAIIDMQAAQQASVTNDSTIPPTILNDLLMDTNTLSLIGTNRSGFGLLRYDGTKLTAAQREIYQTECIQYLTARMQLLERALRRRGVVNIAPIVNAVGK